jgi:hypothetical protein
MRRRQLVLFRLFKYCSTASLAMCLAVCALWARSHVRADALFFDHGGDNGGVFVARSSLGGLWIAVGTEWTEYSRRRGWGLNSARPEPIILGNDDNPGPLWPWPGVSAGRVNSAVFDSFEVAAPHWLPALLFAIPAGLAAFRRLRRCWAG